MSRITPVHWKILECIFLKDGYKLEREESSHRSYSKPGCIRPIIIPKYNNIDQDIIHSNMRSAGMHRDKYLTLLLECKSSRKNH
jgi:predicted RNA binding protein YcfA (HicA-like mRNA interferase family)